jgi:hypothetical protein
VAPGRAVWLRLTLLAPRRGEASCAAWAIAFDRNRPRWFGARSTHPGDRWTPRDDAGVDVAGCSIRPDGSTGEVTGDDGRSLRWDLRWETLAPPLAYFPAQLERLAGGATYPIVAVPVARARGEVVVDGETIAMRDAPLQQSHLFGGRHAHRWGWVHALGFTEDPAGMLTLVWARPRRLGGRVPAVSSLALRVDGALHRSRGLRAVTWRDAGGGRIDFAARAGDARVRGRATLPPEILAGVTYHDPDGSAVHCANTEVADLEVEVATGGGRRTLHCAAACGVERGGRSPMPGIWRPLDTTPGR